MQRIKSLEAKRSASEITNDSGLNLSDRDRRQHHLSAIKDPKVVGRHLHFLEQANDTTSTAVM